MEERMQMPHRLVLQERGKLSVTGVSEVVSFDENAVVLVTVMGTLIIQGQQLQLKTLSVEGGQVAVEGEISAMYYEQPAQRSGWFGRLFR